MWALLVEQARAHQVQDVQLPPILKVFLVGCLLQRPQLPCLALQGCLAEAANARQVAPEGYISNASNMCRLNVLARSSSGMLAR